jgi:hypothetical protein
MFWDLDVQDSRRIESRWAFSDGWTSQNGMRGDWGLNVITIAGSFDSLAVKGTRGWGLSGVLEVRVADSSRSSEVHV